MKKPFLVRLIGFAGWFWAFVIFLIFWGVFHHLDVGLSPLFLWFFGFLMVGCWLVWGVATMVLWVVRAQGRQTAAIVRDAVKPGAPVYTHTAAAPSARLYCVFHREWVPFPSIGNHDTVNCLYVPDLPSRFPRVPETAKAEPVMTSPLGLGGRK